MLTIKETMRSGIVGLSLLVVLLVVIPSKSSPIFFDHIARTLNEIKKALFHGKGPEEFDVLKPGMLKNFLWKVYLVIPNNWFEIQI